MSEGEVKIRFLKEIQLAPGSVTYSDGSERFVNSNVASALVLCGAAVIVGDDGNAPTNTGS